MIITPPAGSGPVPARAYLPEDLDLSFIAPGRLDAARYFVGRLYIARHVAGNAPDEFQKLYSPLLQVLLGSDYRREVIAPLLERGVIEANPSYSTGWKGRAGYSKSYRLAPAYCHGRFHAVPLTNRELLRRLARDRDARVAELDAPVHRHLKCWHDRLTVTPDYPVVSLPLQALADGDRRFEPCRQGRLHSNLTNLARGFRRFVRLDGVEEPLWAVDIKTSQPLLLGLVLQDLDRVEQDEDYVAYANERADQWERKGREKMGRSRLPYLESCSSDRSGDLRHFVDVCLSGDLYDLFVAETGYGRDVVKKRLLATVYGWPHEAGATKTGRAFKRLFPGLWDVLTRLNASDQSRLPCYLQTVESWLVIWRTCGRLAAALPDAPILTIHDCLVTIEPFVEPFRQALEGEYRAVWGVEPQTDVKLLAA